MKIVIAGIIVGFSCSAFAFAQQPPPTAPVQPPQGGYIIPGPASPVVHQDGSISFGLFAPAASSVSLDGDYPIGNGYRNGRSPRPMTKDGKGVWSITVEPLKSEIYSYYFIVDGVPTLDPHNARVGRDGGHFANWAVVPGPGSANYLINDVPHGDLRQVWYPSPTLGITRRAFVYTPPGYDKGTGRYPVFYLVHGGGGDEEAWIDLGRAPEIFDNLLAQGKMVPMIVVIYNGSGGQAAAPNQLLSSKGAENSGTAQQGAGGSERNVGGASYEVSPDRMAAYGRFSDSIAHDLVSFMDSNYRTKADADDRAIAGLSAGGAMTLYTAVNHLGTFSWVGLFSAGLPTMPGMAIDIPKPADADRRRGPDAGRSIDTAKYLAAMPGIGPELNSKFHLLYMSLGLDDGLIEAFVDFRKFLDQKGVKYVWSETPGYGHEWVYWRLNLVEFAPKLFRGTSR